VTSFVDFGCEFEEFGDVLAGFGAGDEDGGVRQEVEIAFKFVEDVVGVIDEVGLRQDDNNSLAGVDDLASERLVEFGMGLGRVDEEGADIGLFDSGEGAEGGELFDTNFAFAWFAEAGSVEDFKGAIVKTDFDTVDVAGRSLARADESLLFLTESVEEAGLANIRAADEGDF